MEANTLAIAVSAIVAIVGIVAIVYRRTFRAEVGPTGVALRTGNERSSRSDKC